MMRALSARWILRAMGLEKCGVMLSSSALRECAEELIALVENREPARTSYYAEESAVITTSAVKDSLTASPFDRDDLNLALGKFEQSYARWDIEEIVAALRKCGIDVDAPAGAQKSAPKACQHPYPLVRHTRDGRRLEVCTHCCHIEESTSALLPPKDLAERARWHQKQAAECYRVIGNGP